MIAYHYTVEPHLAGIKADGLTPRKQPWERVPIYAPIICCFDEHTPHDHVAMAIHHGMKHRSWHIVVLEVTYEQDDLLVRDEDGAIIESVGHNGDLDGWAYHEEVPMICLKNVIPWGRIRIAQELNLLKVFPWPPPEVSDYQGIRRRPPDTVG